MKLCFAASSGGHYEQLMMLRPLMEKYESFIVTENVQYQNSNNEEIKTYYLHQVNRKELCMPVFMLFNSIKVLYIVAKEKPDVVITTGALATIPISLVVKILGGKLVFIESFAKTKSATLTGRFLYHFADQFYVQWIDLLSVFPKAIYKGGIY